GWPTGMVDQDFDRNSFDPRFVHQKLIILDLEIEEHVEVSEALHQSVGMLVVIVSVECRIDCGSDDTLRPELLQVRDVHIKIDNCDALESALHIRDRIKHA